MFRRAEHVQTPPGGRRKDLLSGLASAHSSLSGKAPFVLFSYDLVVPWSPEPIHVVELNSLHKVLKTLFVANLSGITNIYISKGNVREKD